MKKGINLCSGHKIFFAVSKRSHRGNFSVKNAEKMLGFTSYIKGESLHQKTKICLYRSLWHKTQDKQFDNLSKLVSVMHLSSQWYHNITIPFSLTLAPI